MHPIDPSDLLAQALSLESDGDGLAATQDFSAAASTFAKAFDLLKTRQAALRAAAPLFWYDDWDDEGLLAVCRLLYKRAGCCLFLQRADDAQSFSMAVLKAVGAAVERVGGWGRNPFGPAPAKAMYRWGQALHALQYLAAAMPKAAEQQAEALEGSTAADGRPLANVPLTLPGALPARAAAAVLVESPGEFVLCSSPDLLDSSAGMVARAQAVQLDRWHVRKEAEGTAPTLPGRDAPPNSVPLPMLVRVQRRHLQPLAPLLAAYMAQRWVQAPGAPLPEEEPGEYDEENSDGEEDEEDEDGSAPL